MNRVKKQLSLLTVVSTLALVFAGVAQAETLNLFVDVDEATFDAPLGIPGPFNVEGDTGSGAGTYQCWGWIYAAEGDPPANVSQVYSIAGRGTITVQGQEGILMSVVGGTGDFLNVGGEAIQVFDGNGFNFNIEFTLRGERDNDDDSDSDSDSD